LLGEASYGIYLLHWPLWMWLQHLGAMPAAPFALPYFAAYLVLTVALSLLSLRLVEMPARRALRQAFTGRSCAHRPVAEHIAPARPPM
jgi:peptidoglycan/LPS O-acetylase OafA/YrhL